MARVRDREKEFKKHKGAGKKQHPEEVVEKIKGYVGSTAMASERDLTSSGEVPSPAAAIPWRRHGRDFCP